MENSLEGTVIQVFGQFFAGIMNMNMKQWYKVHRDYAGEPFKITGVSPFSIIGTPDPALQKYAECERTNTRVKADIKKNFDLICKRAHCDWFILDNSSAKMGLLPINNRFYSLVGGEETDFTDNYFNNDKAKKRFFRPVQEGFNEQLKDMYNLFIDAILRHYDEEHIILIRSHVPRFYSDNGRIAKTKHTEKTRAFIEILDDYFAEKVNCPVLDTPKRFFETKENPCNYMFDGEQEDLRVAIERDVIYEIENPSARRDISRDPNPRLRNLRTDILETHELYIRELDTLREYWGASGTKIIADYIADGGADLDLIKSYFKYIEYSFDDIAALFWLHEKTTSFWLYDESKDSVAYTEIARAILSNKNGAAYLQTKELFERNINTLRKYEHCLINLDDFHFEDKIIVRLDSKHFLEINPEGLRAFSTDRRQPWDYEKFIADNYTCGIDDIDDALESWETYFERGRRKCRNPFVLRFNSLKEFENSLYFADFEDILDNENYVLAMPDSKPKFLGYEPKVDASFLFDENARIVNLLAGLGDQKYLFLNVKKICTDYELKLFVNDLKYDFSSTHVGAEIQRITAEDIEPYRFSNIFSKKLRLRAIRLRKSFAGTTFVHERMLWTALDFKETYTIVFIDPVVFSFKDFDLQNQYISSVFVPDYSNLRDFIVNKIPKRTAFIHSTTQIYGFSHKSLWEKNFALPKFHKSDLKNVDTAKKMMSHDAISIHIRRGDYARDDLFWCPNAAEYGFYKKQIEFVWAGEEFEKYKKKHLYVFSDDMDWVKEHITELVCNIAGHDITFVDWNHHFNSIYDLHLMSLSKVIMYAYGGFALTAAYISKVLEYVVWANPVTCEITWKRDSITEGESFEKKY